MEFFVALLDAKCSLSSIRNPELDVLSDVYSLIYGQRSLKPLQLEFWLHNWWPQGRCLLELDSDGLYWFKSLSCIRDAPIFEGASANQSLKTAKSLTTLKSTIKEAQTRTSIVF